MGISADTMRLLLVVCLLGMQVLAAFYLRRRRLSVWEYLGWGMLAALVPALGPFLAILLQPGRPAVGRVRRYGRSMRAQLTASARLREFALRIRLTKP